MPRQTDLARQVNMQQSRISMFETPGAANLTIETLGRLAAAFKVGLIVKFVPYSEMLEWENEFSQDAFDVVRIDKDYSFTGEAQGVARRKRKKYLAAAGLIPVGSRDLNQERFPSGTQSLFAFRPSSGTLIGKGDISWLRKSRTPNSPNPRISVLQNSNPYMPTISPSRAVSGI
jgi:transcriptional regulator with XRE-family HTH domain